MLKLGAILAMSGVAASAMSETAPAFSFGDDAELYKSMVMRTSRRLFKAFSMAEGGLKVSDFYDMELFALDKRYNAIPTDAPEFGRVKQLRALDYQLRLAERSGKDINLEALAARLGGQYGGTVEATKVEVLKDAMKKAMEREEEALSKMDRYDVLFYRYQKYLSAVAQGSFDQDANEEFLPFFRVLDEFMEKYPALLDELIPRKMGSFEGYPKEKVMETVTSIRDTPKGPVMFGYESSELPREQLNMDLYVGTTNQASCGSCYAFAAGNLIEMAYTRLTGRHERLSTQVLLDCRSSFKASQVKLKQNFSKERHALIDRKAKAEKLKSEGKEYVQEDLDLEIDSYTMYTSSEFNSDLPGTEETSTYSSTNMDDYENELASNKRAAKLKREAKKLQQQKDDLPPTAFRSSLEVKKRAQRRTNKHGGLSEDSDELNHSPMISYHLSMKKYFSADVETKAKESSLFRVNYGTWRKPKQAIVRKGVVHGRHLPSMERNPCEGGFVNEGLLLVKRLKGLPSASVSPYISGFGSYKSGCSVVSDPNLARAALLDEGAAFKKIVPLYGAVEKIHALKSRNPVELQNMVMHYLAYNGPLAVSVDASKWSSYTGGIFQDCPRGTSPMANRLGTNHAVVLMGYGVDIDEETGKDLPYWLVMNSWTANWGDASVGKGGFIKLPRYDPLDPRNVAVTSFSIPIADYNPKTGRWARQANGKIRALRMYQPVYGPCGLLSRPLGISVGKVSASPVNNYKGEAEADFNEILKKFTEPVKIYNSVQREAEVRLKWEEETKAQELNGMDFEIEEVSVQPESSESQVIVDDQEQ